MRRVSLSLRDPVGREGMGMEGVEVDQGGGRFVKLDREVKLIAFW